MRKPIRTKTALCLLSVLMLTGCTGARELGDLSVVIGMGLDESTECPDGVLLTAQIVRPSEMKGGSSEGLAGDQDGQPQPSRAYWNIQATGETVLDALRECTHETNNRLYLAHNQLIVVGKDAAKAGIGRHFDAFLRHNEPRPSTVLLVSATRASDILDVQPELDKLPAMAVTKLTKTQEFTSQSKAVNIIDYANAMLSKTTSLVIPIATVSEGESGEKTVSIHGSVGAVFKGDRMVGELSESEFRGYLWASGGIRRTVLNIGYRGGRVGIDVVQAGSDIEVSLVNGKVLARVKVKQEGRISDNGTNVAVATERDFRDLEALESEYIRSEIMDTFNKARDMNTDIYGFGEMVSKKYPSEWEGMKDRWDEIFGSLQLEVSVEGKLRSSGLVMYPIRP
ncbi:MAG: Ger(x)C family spore germination protein [Clostridiales bacterium]|nr:Ger(x)C family spore germination protein [Clostridiales bacterium]